MFEECERTTQIISVRFGIKVFLSLNMKYNWLYWKTIVGALIMYGGITELLSVWKEFHSVNAAFFLAQPHLLLLVVIFSSKASRPRNNNTLERICF